MMRAGWRDYLALTKPHIVVLLMVTAIAGMFLATRPAAMVPLSILIPAGVGLSLAMMASAGINQIAEHRLDAIMRRTRHRPLVTGRLNITLAVIFVAVLAVTGFAILYLLVNPLTALMTFGGFVGYAFVYTLFLKRTTSQNIVIGGLAGAIPPLLGWTAVTGQMPASAWLLVAIIFLWTPPHFWPLAIARVDDYAAGGIPMLPVTHGVLHTRKWVLRYTVLLCVGTLMPVATGMSGVIYLATAIVLDSIFMAYALKLRLRGGRSLAMHTFGYSIIYLYALFTALLLDHYLLFPLSSFVS